MKKRICLLLTAIMALSLCFSGAAASAQDGGAWTLQGYFADEAGNMASVTWMDDVVEPGWYVAFLNGEDFIEDSYGGTLNEEGNTLCGTLSSEGSRGDLTVTLSEEGDGGLQLAVEGGEVFRFAPMEMEEPFCAVTIDTTGVGRINYAEGEEAPDLDGERFTFFGFPLYEPTTLTIGARADEDDWYFVKWTRNGEDYSTDPVFTAEISEDSDFVAVFDWSGADGQNPVMNFIGPYASGLASAQVACSGDDGARVTIVWGSSAWDQATWVMSGPFDPDTMTVEYADCVKSVVTYGKDGKVIDETVEYRDGAGSIVFDGPGFTWKGDQGDLEDLVFEWAWDPDGSDVPAGEIAPDAVIDLGGSELYTQEELEDAVLAIELQFAAFEGCELHSIRYAGDEANNEENLAWMNSLDEGAEYVQVAEFLTDYHSPVEDGPYAWEPDTEYTDYQWWLARSADGGWEVVTWGY